MRIDSKNEWMIKLKMDASKEVYNNKPTKKVKEIKVNNKSDYIST